MSKTEPQERCAACGWPAGDPVHGNSHPFLPAETVKERRCDKLRLDLGTRRMGEKCGNPLPCADHPVKDRGCPLCGGSGMVAYRSGSDTLGEMCSDPWHDADHPTQEHTACGSVDERVIRSVCNRQQGHAGKHRETRRSHNLLDPYDDGERWIEWEATPTQEQDEREAYKDARAESGLSPEERGAFALGWKAGVEYGRKRK